MSGSGGQWPNPNLDSGRSPLSNEDKGWRHVEIMLQDFLKGSDGKLGRYMTRPEEHDPDDWRGIRNRKFSEVRIMGHYEPGLADRLLHQDVIIDAYEPGFFDIQNVKALVAQKLQNIGVDILVRK